VSGYESVECVVWTVAEGVNVEGRGRIGEIVDGSLRLRELALRAVICSLRSRN
jgi:hypothetical protein